VASKKKQETRPADTNQHTCWSKQPLPYKQKLYLINLNVDKTAPLPDPTTSLLYMINIESSVNKTALTTCPDNRPRSKWQNCTREALIQASTKVASPSAHKRPRSLPPDSLAMAPLQQTATSSASAAPNRGNSPAHHLARGQMRANLGARRAAGHWSARAGTPPGGRGPPSAAAARAAAVTAVAGGGRRAAAAAARSGGVGTA
jgi:hypothetical protein